MSIQESSHPNKKHDKPLTKTEVLDWLAEHADTLRVGEILRLLTSQQMWKLLAFVFGGLVSAGTVGYMISAYVDKSEMLAEKATHANDKTTLVLKHSADLETAQKQYAKDLAASRDQLDRQHQKNIEELKTLYENGSAQQDLYALYTHWNTEKDETIKAQLKNAFRDRVKQLVMNKLVDLKPEPRGRSIQFINYKGSALGPRFVVPFDLTE